MERRLREPRRPGAAAALGVAALLLLAPSPATTQEKPFPLEPADRSSPRATLATFNESFERAWEGFSQKKPGWREAFIEAARCLDSSEIPEAVRETVVAEGTLLLKEVLDRVPPFPEDEAPDAEGAEGLERWRVPHTEINLIRVASGERAGEFLFSADSVARIREFYDKVQDLPYQPGREGAHYDELRFGGLSPGVSRIARLLPPVTREEIAGALVWQWGAVVVSLVLAGLLAAWAFRLGRRVAAGELARKGRRGLGSVVFPLSLLALALASREIAFQFLRLAGVPYVSLRMALTAVGHLAVAWLIAVALARLGEAVGRAFQAPGQNLNVQLVGVSFRILTILAVTGYLFFAAQTLGLPVPALVAGLGVGGLAVALATQSTLENLIGGLILYADRPVRVGDVFRLGDGIGIVEEIGLRSTRVRTRDRTVIAIPNADLVRREIENLTLRDQIPFRTTLRLRLETTPDQLRYLVTTLTRMLREHPGLVEDTGQARLAGFGESSLEIELRAFAATTDFDEFLAIRQDLLLRVMSLVEDAGTRLAVPVAVELEARDVPPDEARARSAAETARRWRSEGSLGFPQFDAEKPPDS